MRSLNLQDQEYRQLRLRLMENTYLKDTYESRLRRLKKPVVAPSRYSTLEKPIHRVSVTDSEIREPRTDSVARVHSGRFRASSVLKANFKYEWVKPGQLQVSPDPCWGPKHFIQKAPLVFSLPLEQQDR